jgi:predicted nucleotidyltransferase
MDMREEWLRDLRSWASKNESVRQLWLFGSRARGDSREDSDVDLALALIPPVGKHDFALHRLFPSRLVPTRRVAIWVAAYSVCSLPRGRGLG